ncbi:MAG: ribonuclease HI, partial [Bacteroidales bacterium]|nr:ribonuclease HI [Bacteroidales bacterium]
MELKKVTITTDGACSGNPGPGGYAAKLRFGEHFKEIAGFESQTTNNRMELRAVIEGMLPLKVPCSITIRTDSQVVCNAIAN